MMDMTELKSCVCGLGLKIKIEAAHLFWSCEGPGTF